MSIDVPNSMDSPHFCTCDVRVTSLCVPWILLEQKQHQADAQGDSDYGSELDEKPMDFDNSKKIHVFFARNPIM